MSKNIIGEVIEQRLLKLPKPRLRVIAISSGAMPDRKGFKSKEDLVRAILKKNAFNDIRGVINKGSVVERNLLRQKLQKRRFAHKPNAREEFQYRLWQTIKETSIVERNKVKVLVEFLRDKEVTSYKQLIEVIKNPEIAVVKRANICWFVSRIEPDRGQSCLIKLLNAPEAEIRSAAAIELRAYSHPKVIKKLIQALKDSEEMVKLAAIDTLGHLEATEAVEALISILLNKKESCVVSIAAAIALARLKEESAISPLREVLVEAESMELVFWINYALEEIDRKLDIDGTGL